MDLVEAADPLLILKKRFEQANMGNVHIVQNEWMIHFTNKADIKKIVANGFLRGSPLTTRDLSYTVGSTFKTPGINFAYPTDDEQELRLNEGIVPPDAVMFRADGVRMRHTEDFLQVAFMGQSAQRPFYQIRRNSDGSWKLISVDGTAVKAAESMSLLAIVAKVTSQ